MNPLPAPGFPVQIDQLLQGFDKAHRRDRISSGLIRCASQPPQA